jgi:ABC-2 type transport system ATP-binding protein
MILEAGHLNKWYGRVTALSGASLRLEPGITGLLGPNGAGKTSLLRIAIGLMKPSSGTIRVLGQSPWNNPRLAVRLGYGPEHDGFYEWMTGREFVTALARLRAVRNPGEAAAAALDRVRLDEVADRRISTYSRGMRQRLKIAQALAHGPELLFLDEPLTGCDPLVRTEIIALIRGFAAAGGSAVVSSHVLHEIEALTRRIVLIHRGRLVAEGEIGEIRDLIDRHPHTVRVATDRARELAAALAAEPEVVEILIEEGALRVRTPKPDAFYRKLPAIALERGCGIREISSPDDNLEAVFRYLTER